MFKIICFSVFLITYIGTEALAQRGDQFMLANELIRNGEFEEAYSILEGLLEQNPDSYPIFERTVTVLINLKRFDDAIRISKDRFNDNYSDIVSAAKLGELYHINGETGKAHQIWNNTISHNEHNLQAYRHIAQTMRDRRAHTDAIEIYLQARDVFNQPGLFANEIASNWLITGNYEEAMREYLKLIANNRDFMHQVKRQLMNFDEQYLFDVAILETEDELSNFRNNSTEADSFREFLIWLYMERGLHRRALTTARNLETSSQETKHAMYDLGDRLRTQNEFELAESAFSFYTERPDHEMRAQSLEQTARVYMNWADYLLRNNLDFGTKSDSLYRQASITLQTLNNDYPRYHRRSDVLLLQAELALDHLKDVEEAQKYHEILQSLSQSRASVKPNVDYIEGRIYLFNEDFNRARIAFTRSNKESRIGNLADKTRFYLALSDFYGGDYEFSQIQLRALERQNTSYFANNALQLRLWIQEGVNRGTSTEQLDAFSRARFYYQVTGDHEKAMEALSPLLNEYRNHPLNGEAVLLATSIIRNLNGHAAYHLISRNTGFVPSEDMSQVSHVRLNPASVERIFWERARLADLVYFDQSTSAQLAELPGQQYIPEELTYDPGTTLINSVDEVISAYEELLMEFPQGFYASRARGRIQELSSYAN